MANETTGMSAQSQTGDEEENEEIATQFLKAVAEMNARVREIFHPLDINDPEIVKMFLERLEPQSPGLANVKGLSMEQFSKIESLLTLYLKISGIEDSLEPSASVEGQSTDRVVSTDPRRGNQPSKREPAKPSKLPLHQPQNQEQSEHYNRNAVSLSKKGRKHALGTGLNTIRYANEQFARLFIPDDQPPSEEPLSHPGDVCRSAN